jgi:hypothetical protein
MQRSPVASKRVRKRTYSALVERDKDDLYRHLSDERARSETLEQVFTIDRSSDIFALEEREVRPLTEAELRPWRLVRERQERIEER